MKKVTIVLGMGLSGIAAAELLLKSGALVLGIDGNHTLLEKSDEIHRLQALGLFVQHDAYPIEWSQVERLVVSPGVSPKHPIYQGALENNITVLGETELALPHFKKSLIAVTGTNGKTTVTLLVEHILNFCGIKAKALGNVGTPLCRFAAAPADEEVFVVELSSYQLETMHTAVFDAAVVLNVTPDHLERYAGMQEYAQAKCRLQTLVKKEGLFFVQQKIAAEYQELLEDKNYQTFGMEKSADLWTDQSEIVYREKVECILPLDYRIRGSHDCENALAAWALCLPFAISNVEFCQALSSFKKPPHRIEFIREHKGVSYYDDSKGTNIDAVMQAVKVMKGPVVLIVGGVDKGASYLPWKEAFAGCVKQIFAIGEAATKIYQELHPYFNIKIVDSLSAAVQAAASIAQCGDSVLLSPGCSSYDMFRDYAQRGEEFQHYVQSLRK